MEKRLFKLIYNDVPCLVDPVLFSKESKFFCENYDPNSPDDVWTLRSSISAEIFEMFIEAVQNKNAPLTAQNIYMMQELANEWKVDSLLARTQQFIDNQTNNPNELVALMNERIRKNQSYQDLIPLLAVHIDELISNPSFGLLKHEILTSILQHEQCHVKDQHALLKFLLTMIDLKRPISAVLNCLDPSIMNQDEIDAVLNNVNVSKKHIPTFLVNLSKFLSNQLKMERNTLARLNERNHELEAELKRKNNREKREMNNRQDQKSARGQGRNQMKDGNSQPANPPNPPKNKNRKKPKSTQERPPPPIQEARPPTPKQAPAVPPRPITPPAQTPPAPQPLQAPIASPSVPAAASPPPVQIKVEKPKSHITNLAPEQKAFVDDINRRQQMPVIEKPNKSVQISRPKPASNPGPLFNLNNE